MSSHRGQATVLVVAAMTIGTGLVTIAAAFCVGAVARAHAQRVADEVALIVAARAATAPGASTDLRLLGQGVARREGARLDAITVLAGTVVVTVSSGDRTFTLPASLGGARLRAGGSASSRAVVAPGGPRLAG